MPKQDRTRLNTLRAQLLEHPVERDERALRAACNSIEARIELWNGTLSTLRERRAA